MQSTHLIIGVRHNIKDHSDSERGNPLLPLHGYSFSLEGRDILNAQSYKQDGTHHNFCYTNCGTLAGSIQRLIGHSNSCITVPITVTNWVSIIIPHVG